MCASDNKALVNEISKYYNLLVESKSGNAEKILVKKLRSILNTDIHENSLGCRIDDTHVKIGNIHMSSFFEARFMFSQQKWIIRFANWLWSQVISDSSGKILFIGYETYLEPVLSHLKLNHQDKVEYCIYEVEKHLSANPSEKTNARIRYLENISQQSEDGRIPFSKIIFICGISSTLSTYKKMQDKFNETIGNCGESLDYDNFALIQVLPETDQTSFMLNLPAVDRSFRRSKKTEHEKNEKNKDEKKCKTVLEWNTADKTVRRIVDEKSTIEVKYLVDVYSKWQLASECVWCFGENERPLIAVDDTSVVPQQIITPFEKIKRNTVKDVRKINFFAHKDEFIDCIYYNHIERGYNHYQYYIRTAALFWKITHNDLLMESFKEFCSDVKRDLVLQESDKKIVNIIITPIHFSNVLFPHYINHYVFNDEAHIITVEPKKEFRSNFVTKYSNYSYLYKQCEEENVDVRYHFIDDQIVTGSAFYRAESLVRSLKDKYHQNTMLNTVNQTKNDVKRGKDESVFYSSIILLNRISGETQKNYIENGRFYSLIDLEISHLRNHGDACPLCKQTYELKNVSDNSALIATKYFWSEKAHYHNKQTIGEVKQKVFEKDPTQRIFANKRYFTRFECENILTKCSDKFAANYIELKKELFESIYIHIYHEEEISEQIEILISFIKALSRPFLYYHENVKKFAMCFLLDVVHGLTESVYRKNKLIIYKDKYYGENDIRIPLNKSFIEQYSLLCVTLNQLAAIGSNYLLKMRNIVEVMIFVNRLSEDLKQGKEGTFFNLDEKINSEEYDKTVDDLCGFSDKINYRKNKTGQEYIASGIGSIIANNYKRIICGISGTDKIEKMDHNQIDNFFKLKKFIDEHSTGNYKWTELLHDCKSFFDLCASRPSKMTLKDYINLLDDKSSLILEKIEKYKLRRQNVIHSLREKDLSKKYAYIRRMYLYIFFIVDFIESQGSQHRKEKCGGELYEVLINVLEIIYLENCHALSREDNNTEIINKITINKQLCISSDADSNGNIYYLFDEKLIDELEGKTDTSDKEKINIEAIRLEELFLDTNIEDNITITKKNILDAITKKGFFYCGERGRWLILLWNGSVNKYAFLSVELKSKGGIEPLDLKEQFVLIKQIIRKERPRLTASFETAIKNGSLYNSVKKHVASRILASEKLHTHGKSNDIINLYKVAKKMLANVSVQTDDNDNEDRNLTYATINVLMNRLISLGAGRNTYETYFGGGLNLDPLCNLMQKDTKVTSHSQFREYINYVTGTECEYVNNIYSLYSPVSKVEKNCCRINLVSDIPIIKSVPQLLSKLDEYCHEDSDIWLIGIVDVFLRNAIKHSPYSPNKDSVIELSFTDEEQDRILLDGTIKAFKTFTCTIINDKSLCEDDSNEIHLTHIFFMDFLKDILVKDEQNYVKVEKVSDNEKYILKIMFHYTCDESINNS